MERTYNEMAQRASSDPEVCKYLVWLKKSFGSEGMRQIRMFGACNSQGYDFGAWLIYIGFEREDVAATGFQRRTRG